MKHSHSWCLGYGYEGRNQKAKSESLLLPIEVQNVNLMLQIARLLRNMALEQIVEHFLNTLSK